MKSTLSFFYKTILNKKSIYIFSGILIFVFILITYILPTVLKININQLLQMSIIMVLLVLLIAIFAIILSTTIFRQGIDDGSELLIITKSISRKEIVLSKTIVLLSIIFIESIFAFIVPIFLIFFKYGTNYPWDYSGGYFLTTLIVSILFSGISIFFCLIMKKMHATFFGLAIAFLLTLINSVNFMITQATGYYMQKNNYSIQNVSYYNSSSKSISGVILNYNNKPYITNKKSNIIQNIEDSALDYTKTNIYSYVDPFFQFTTLFSLGNFYYSNNNFSGKDIENPNNIFRNLNWSNLYLSFNEISNFEPFKKFKIYIDNNLVDYTYIFNNDVQIVNNSRSINFNLKQKEIDLGNYFIFPELEYEEKNIITSLNLKIYDLSNKNDLQNLTLLMFDEYDNKSSIYNLYIKYQNFIKKTNNSTLIDYYSFTSFLYTYLNLGYSILFEDIFLNKDLNINVGSLNFKVSGDKLEPIFSKLINYLEVDKNTLRKYFNIKNSNELLNINYLKPSLLFLIFTRSNIMNYQKWLLNYIENNYVLDLSEIIVKNIFSIFQIKSSLFSNFIVLLNKNIANKNMELINNYLNSLNPGYISNLINSLNFTKTFISSNPYQLVDVKTMNTFSSYQYNYYLNIYGLVFGWLLISSLLLVISTIIYSKKDIK